MKVLIQIILIIIGKCIDILYFIVFKFEGLNMRQTLKVLISDVQL
jgi:hypothetical protein